MPRFEIVLESHEGVFSVEEETVGTIEASSKEDALEEFAKQDKRMNWISSWKCWCYGSARKVFAREIK